MVIANNNVPLSVTSSPTLSPHCILFHLIFRLKLFVSSWQDSSITASMSSNIALIFITDFGDIVSSVHFVFVRDALRVPFIITNSNIICHHVPRSVALCNSSLTSTFIPMAGCALYGQAHAYLPLQPSGGHPPTRPPPSNTPVPWLPQLLPSPFLPLGPGTCGAPSWEHPFFGSFCWLALLFRCYWEKPCWAILSKGTSSILSFLSPFLSHHCIYYLQSTYITVCKSLVSSLIYLTLVVSPTRISAPDGQRPCRSYSAIFPAANSVPDTEEILNKYFLNHE